MQLHSGCGPIIGGGGVVRNAGSASTDPSLRSQDLTTARHFRRSLRGNFGRMSAFTRGHHPPLCSCIVGDDQSLMAAELSAMRSPQAPPPSRRSQDLTTARHFRRSPRADSGKMSTFAKDHHPSLCSCIVGDDQSLMAAELSAMRSPQAAQFCTNRQNAPGLHSLTWGNAGALSIRTNPAGPEGPEDPEDRRNAQAGRPKTSSAASRRRGRTTRGPARC